MEMIDSEEERRRLRLEEELLEALRSGDIELLPKDLERDSLVGCLRQKLNL